MTSTAILIFARTADAECAHKQLVDDVPGNKLLFDALNKRVELLAAKSGLPFYIYNESCQTGGNFGEKLSNALTETFAKGHAHVIVIGNDCPLLKARQLLKTAQILQYGQMVIGADHHGGAYLIGISNAHFNKISFQNLRWQTAYLYTDLQNYQSGSIQLERSVDINTIDDVNTIIRILPFYSPLKKLFLYFLNHCVRLVKFYTGFYISIFIKQLFSLRAPPLLS